MNKVIIGLVLFVALIVNSKPCEAKTLTERYQEIKKEIIELKENISKDYKKVKEAITGEKVNETKAKTK